METMRVQLPPVLMQRLRQETSSDEVLNSAVIEAIQMWLSSPRRVTSERKTVQQALSEAGMTMLPERQQALAQAIMSRLHVETPPTRAQVQAALRNLLIPLSDEIIAMRGE
ncbi:MAG: hypothetical protein AUK03_10855 [Anaerolineae bacterium CG2_30_64_16]|nr:MAG: hypothetical protein AUK03_10855 [Anaerolineae bacterium CG2_30_64_16]